MPCTVRSSTSSRARCPASSACRAATEAQRTRSPRTPSSGSSLTRPGRSSPIGKASTSAGPGLSIHCPLSAAMVASSTTLMHSSAIGCTRIWSITKRESRDRSETSSSSPDSLRISMLTAGSSVRSSSVSRAGAPRAAAVRLRPRLRRLALRLVVVVRRDDVPDQPVPYHVVGGEPVERDVLDAVEDLLDDAQPAPGARGQVDLGDVARHDHLRAEAQPGEEHLHLLGGG